MRAGSFVAYNPVFTHSECISDTDPFPIWLLVMSPLDEVEERDPQHDRLPKPPRSGAD